MSCRARPACCSAPSMYAAPLRRIALPVAGGGGAMSARRLRIGGGLRRGVGAGGSEPWRQTHRPGPRRCRPGCSAPIRWRVGAFAALRRAQKRPCRRRSRWDRYRGRCPEIVWDAVMVGLLRRHVRHAWTRSAGANTAHGDVLSGRCKAGTEVCACVAAAYWPRRPGPWRRCLPAEPEPAVARRIGRGRRNCIGGMARHLCRRCPGRCHFDSDCRYPDCRSDPDRRHRCQRRHWKSGQIFPDIGRGVDVLLIRSVGRIVLGITLVLLDAVRLSSGGFAVGSHQMGRFWRTRTPACRKILSSTWPSVCLAGGIAFGRSVSLFRRRLFGQKIGKGFVVAVLRLGGIVRPGGGSGRSSGDGQRVGRNSRHVMLPGKKRDNGLANSVARPGPEISPPFPGFFRPLKVKQFQKRRAGSALLGKLCRPNAVRRLTKIPCFSGIFGRIKMA